MEGIFLDPVPSALWCHFCDSIRFLILLLFLDHLWLLVTQSVAGQCQDFFIIHFAFKRPHLSSGTSLHLNPFITFNLILDVCINLYLRVLSCSLFTVRIFFANRHPMSSTVSDAHQLGSLNILCTESTNSLCICICTSFTYQYALDLLSFFFMFRQQLFQLIFRTFLVYLKTDLRLYLDCTSSWSVRLVHSSNWSVQLYGIFKVKWHVAINAGQWLCACKNCGAYDCIRLSVSSLLPIKTFCLKLGFLHPSIHGHWPQKLKSPYQNVESRLYTFKSQTQA